MVDSARIFSLLTKSYRQHWTVSAFVSVAPHQNHSLNKNLLTSYRNLQAIHASCNTIHHSETNPRHLAILYTCSLFCSEDLFANIKTASFPRARISLSGLLKLSRNGLVPSTQILVAFCWEWCRSMVSRQSVHLAGKRDLKRRTSPCWTSPKAHSISFSAFRDGSISSLIFSSLE